MLDFLQKIVYKMAKDNAHGKEEADKNRIYFIIQKKQSKSKLKNKIDYAIKYQCYILCFIKIKLLDLSTLIQMIGDK